MELTGDELCLKCEKMIAEEKGFITGIEENSGMQVYICLSCAVDMGVTAGNKMLDSLPTINVTSAPQKKRSIN